MSSQQTRHRILLGLGRIGALLLPVFPAIKYNDWWHGSWGMLALGLLSGSVCFAASVGCSRIWRRMGSCVAVGLFCAPHDGLFHQLLPFLIAMAVALVCPIGGWRRRHGNFPSSLLSLLVHRIPRVICVVFFMVAIFLIEGAVHAALVRLFSLDIRMWEGGAEGHLNALGLAFVSYCIVCGVIIYDILFVHIRNKWVRTRKSGS